VYRLYAGGVLYLDPIFVPAPSKVKVSETSARPKAEEPSQPEGQAPEGAKEALEYTLEWHLEGKPESIRELMSLFRERIFALGEAEEIIENVTKIYIGYRHGKNFCEVQPLQSHIKLWLDIDPSELDDPHGCGRDVTHIGHHGTGQVEVKLKDPAELDDVMSLVKQAYLLTL
jgi:predicted transport protein